MIYRAVIEWNNAGQADKHESLHEVKDMKLELGKKISIRKMLSDIFGEPYMIEHGWPEIDKQQMCITYTEEND